MAPKLALEVAHSVLYVQDVDTMVDFYTDVLGFEVTDRGPLGPPDGPEIVFLSQVSNHHHQVAFITGRPEASPSNSVNHVAYRSSGTLDDLRQLHDVLTARDDVSGIRPLCHGNAWSIYFADPERNGIEIFIDSPFHVAQPQGKPLDFSLSNDEIAAWTEEEFSQEPEFGPIDDFYAKRAAELG